MEHYLKILFSYLLFVPAAIQLGIAAVGAILFINPLRKSGSELIETHRDGNGISLTSIESIAESYGGTALFEHKDKEFCSNVVLPTMK